MPRELHPSSYECDCGHVSDFFESTINEMKRTWMIDSSMLVPRPRSSAFYSGNLGFSCLHFFIL